MSEKNIEIVREYNFDPKEVIAGLNGYYESDKRNGYITVRRNDVEPCMSDRDRSHPRPSDVKKPLTLS